MHFIIVIYDHNRPHITLAITEYSYILLVLFLFSIHRFVDVPEPYFCETLPHYMVCYETDYVLWGVHTCPIKSEGQKTQFSPICGPKVSILI